METEKELSFTLDVKHTSKGLEHELSISTDGFNKSETQDITDIVNEDVDYFIEDIRRRVRIK